MRDRDTITLLVPVHNFAGTCCARHWLRYSRRSPLRWAWELAAIASGARLWSGLGVQTTPRWWRLPLAIWNVSPWNVPADHLGFSMSVTRGRTDFTPTADEFKAALKTAVEEFHDFRDTPDA